MPFTNPNPLLRRHLGNPPEAMRFKRHMLGGIGLVLESVKLEADHRLFANPNAITTSKEIPFCREKNKLARVSKEHAAHDGVLALHDGCSDHPFSLQ
eukprot:CAMPEP_0197708110 /NCGR_PEP_ID=MMETSP1338-20131121/127789_1 /TAXON_ID=43686 ORGANISM="Pelagodinium beii, Strain RCC1491" /NCGR_SAMPLE_ID=MMETSP1338 /ASSEMBLY_ACC=CAM_ASM_000754 /LENGTH=96 /DNA_ID=CAMNT_0043292039 /DNA_START=941 /DNA_END=1228 /DNA_ORIENTATION=-